MMRCKNKNYSLFLILFKLLLLPADSSSCPSKCGGVRIPYPFGIGKSCYLEKSYEIECRSTARSRKPVPFLSVINKEVVSISLPNMDNSVVPSYGIVRIRSPITYTGCFTSTDGKETGAPIMNLTGSPMFIYYRNRLIAFGCNSKVSLTHVEPDIVGCELNCSMSKGNILSVEGCPRDLFSSETYYVCTKDEFTSCSGNGCCETFVPNTPQQVLGIRIESNDGNSTKRTKQEHCRVVAFVTDELDHMPSGTNPQKLLAKGHYTVSLGWIFQTKNTSYLNSLACKNATEYDYDPSNISERRTKCICQFVRNSSEMRFGNCGCNQGYSGNPYIVDGCKDIDECKLGTHSCEEGQNCVNTPGHYKCVGDKTKSILIGVGSGFGVLALVGGVWWLRKFLIKRRIEKRKQKFFKRNGGLLLQQELNTSDGNVEKTRIFTSRELEKATEKFSENRVIGQGGQGTVYKGMLVDGRTVAVKKSKVIDEDKLQEFINEVVILSQINHRHIVKLLGCCLETEVPILVYEFILNGNLFQHIHEESDDYTMIWGMRLRMAVDVAGALSYLHSSASSAIYHRDIKSTNILLDEKHRAKVADFGTSRSITIDQTHWTTVVSGTVGYVDPEYYRSSQFTDKSDVYSFGVVLAELITGEKPVIMVGNTRGTVSLADHFRLAIKEKRLDDIVDARIKEDCKLEQVMAVANLAMKCLSSKGNKRPNMREVFTELERICTSPDDSQVQVMIDDEEEDEEEEEEVRNMVNNGDSLTAGVTAPALSTAASPSSSDAEPLFPRPTW